MAKLEGPRREPKLPVESLVVLVHGYGASGEDLIALADAWRELLPRTAFVAPHAAERVPFAGGGYQWFPLTMRDPGEYWRGAVNAAPALDGFLDNELARYHLRPDRMALVGFSQGTMMALHVGPRRHEAFAALVGFSGVIAGPENLAGQVRAHTPVQLIHGELDDVIPVEALHLTREVLAAAGILLEWHIREDLGHGIDPAGLALAGSFLRQQLAVR
jgi:phospholipase/carboxylesterase